MTLDDFDPSRRQELFDALDEAKSLLCRALVSPGWPGDDNGHGKFSNLYDLLAGACKELQPKKEYWVKVEIVETTRNMGTVITKASSEQEAIQNVKDGKFWDYSEDDFLETTDWEVVDVISAYQHEQ